MRVDNGDLLLTILLAAAALSFGAVVFLLVNPHLSGERRVDKRLEGVTDKARRATAGAAQADPIQSRRRQVAEAIDEMEQREKTRAKVTLRVRLERAGLPVNPRAYWTTSALSGVLVGVLTWVMMPSVSIIVPILGAFIGTLGLPRFVLSRLTKRRQNKFLDEFANAIDIIVRGVKSGLPLGECLAITARESPQPVAGEFAGLVEQQRVGVPLADAFERMMARMPLPEVRFFAMVISIQAQTGGSLSEALANLAGVLRDRKRLQQKVRAHSAEARASAYVLGSLPVVVMILVYVSSPTYIALLWTTQIGQMLMVASGVWMLCGVLVMRKMINFKY
jgi:tight adherence protein B